MNQGKKEKGAAPWEELSQLHLRIQRQLSTVVDEEKKHYSRTDVNTSTHSIHRCKLIPSHAVRSNCSKNG